jgi:hypothetical protein
MTGSSTLSGINPLSYLGVKPVTPAPVYFSNRAPNVNDIQNFSLSTIWLDRTSDDVYMLVNKEGGIATWVRLGGNPNDITQFTMPDSSIVESINGNINYLNGPGISITGTTPNITITATLTPWTVVTTTTQQLAINEGYFANNNSGVTFTLPAVAAVGDFISISSINAGGWIINQNTGQSIRLGTNVSTTTTGSIASTSIGNTVSLVCSVADTEFVVISSIGNINIT